MHLRSSPPNARKRPENKEGRSLRTVITYQQGFSNADLEENKALGTRQEILPKKTQMVK